ncbi:hypothetical protein AVEN_150825-1 [Araneus ventricosus]|uniref:Uncharacterized protein n=1 Tax=Araneus ventricosus TaxID=182803 RepID=A0A4Y2V2X6_ARAVE|nr:hypothetical protein AVEN_150825-1 [Araneus ventricosus]
MFTASNMKCRTTKPSANSRIDDDITHSANFHFYHVTGSHPHNRSQALFYFYSLETSTLHFPFEVDYHFCHPLPKGWINRLLLLLRLLKEN